MAKTTNNIDLYKSNRDNWQTPPFIIECLLKHFKIKRFDYDLCCDQFNIPAKRYITKNGIYRLKLKQNSVIKVSNNDYFKSNFSGLCYMNPVFKITDKFLKKLVENKKDCNVVALLPVRTNCVYWHDLVFNKASAIFFFKRKINFYIDNHSVCGDGNPSPICLAFYNFKYDKIKDIYFEKHELDGTMIKLEN